MRPIKLIPAFKDYIWGGTRLRDEYHKTTDLSKVAESWELSCHKDGRCLAADGEYKGLTLEEIVEREGREILGKNAQRFAFFPVLVKLIDAKGDLSIQVHPSDEYALRVEKEYGKTEMWYIVDCEPGAYLYYGFNRNMTRETFEKAIADNTLVEYLNKVPVKKGEVYFIDAGTLHAICSGILIAEIQQNSNSTYRVYDYGRLGADGKPRPLHVQKALDVTRLTRETRGGRPQGCPRQEDGAQSTLLASCEYFTVYEVKIDKRYAAQADNKSFLHLLSTDFEGSFCCGDTTLSLAKGEGLFVPAGAGAFFLQGNGTVLQTSV